MRLSYPLIFCLAASPLAANPQNTAMLEDYFSNLEGIGAALSVGDKSETTSATRWEDIAVTWEEGAGQMTIDFIEVVAEKDAHRFIFGPEIKVEVDVETGEDVPLDGPLSLSMTHENLNVIVSGPREARRYDVDAKTIAVTSGEGTSLDLDLRLSGWDYDVTADLATGGRVVGTFQMGSMDVEYALAVEEVQMNATSELADLKGRVDLPQAFGALAANPNLLQAEGQTMAVSYSAGGYQAEITAVAEGISQKMNQAMESATAEMTLADQVFKIGAGGNAMSFKMADASGALPPIDASMDAVEILYKIPFKADDTAQEAAIKVGFTGVTLSDDLWAQFDPNAALDRSKADLIIDLAADVRMSQDVTTLLTEEPTKGIPFELDEVRINEIKLKALGALAAAKGSFQIDNSIGRPMPSGTGTVQIKNLIEAAQSLVDAGILPAEQIFAVMAFSGMFFQPNGDDGTLESRIEFTADGILTANGIPIPLGGPAGPR